MKCRRKPVIYGAILLKKKGGGEDKNSNFALVKLTSVIFCNYEAINKYFSCFSTQSNCNSWKHVHCLCLLVSGLGVKLIHVVCGRPS